MEQEYKIGIGWKLFYGAIVIGMVFFSMFLLMKTSASSNQIASVVPVLLILTGAIVLALYILKRRITISDTRIEVRGAFRSRELFNSNVKGFRVASKVIFIEPLLTSYSRIRINDYDSIGNHADFIKSLEYHYVNLDALDYQNEVNEILQDQELGSSDDDRKVKFNRAKYAVFAFNSVGFAFFISLVFFVEFFLKSNFLNVLWLLYPLVGIILIVYSKGLIKLVTSPNSAYFSVYLGILFPVMMLVVKAIVVFKIIEYQHVWVLFVIISLLVFILIYIKGLVKTKNRVLGQTILLGIISVTYSYGSIIMTNCTFDNSIPKIIEVTVLKTEVRNNKGRQFYYLTLNPWLPNQKAPEVQVSEPACRNAVNKNTVFVSLKKGLLNIPWYYIKD